MQPRTKSIGYRIILLVMFAPMIFPFVTGVIAWINGCDLDEGNPHPCVVFGSDIGQVLYEVSLLGFLGMATFPLGIIALIVFALIVRLTK